jgi:hypothetical protein
MRYVDTGNENLTCVEVENVVVEFPKGRLFGEIALTNPDKATRMLSGMTKNDSILLVFNQEAFDIIIKEKLKKEREEIGRFVCNSMPNLTETIGFQAVSSNVHVVFEKSVININ